MLTVLEAAVLLRTFDNVLILTHVRPDGDTVGCAAALCAGLRALGKTAYLLPNSGLTDTTAPYFAPYAAPADFTPDKVVSTDIAALSLLPENARPYGERVDLAMDHHPSFEGFGAYQCVDATCAACGEIIYELCRELGEVTPEVALPLYAAISTDTGCFVYANTTAHTHAVAAALLETGIDYFAVNKRHFRTKSRRRIALEAALMGTLEFFHDGKGVFLTVPLSLMERLGATENDAEDLSTLAGIIEGVDCGAVLRELKEGTWKLSLRTGANGRVNATEVCRQLGGGGHAMAAGATLEGSLEQVKERILEAVDRVKKF